MSTDTHANSMLNIIFREYGSLSDAYRIIGFDDSPIAAQAILPISTVGQQIDKIAYEAMELLVTRMDERKKRRPKPHGIDSQKDNANFNSERNNGIACCFTQLTLGGIFFIF